MSFDVVQNYDPNFSGGANDPSLNDAKNNYIKYKVADKKNKKCFKNSGFVFNERVGLYFYDKRVASPFLSKG
jgi:hypothetical protein